MSFPTKEHCGFSHSESEKQPLRANGFNRMVSRGHIPENVEQSPGYSPWPLRASGCYGPMAFRGGGEPGTSTITGERIPLWQQHHCQKSAGAWLYTVGNPACTRFLAKGWTTVQRPLQPSEVTLLSKGRQEPLHELRSLISVQSVPHLN